MGGLLDEDVAGVHNAGDNHIYGHTLREAQLKTTSQQHFSLTYYNCTYKINNVDKVNIK